MQPYKTVRKQAESEMTEKGSRFIATVSPVSAEDKVREFIAAMRKKYWNATHNVYAYCVGGVWRQSDDGEPSGTAGMPVLEVIRAQELTDTAINVTRYFGGTLLGAGGLVRAYSRAAREGVTAAGVVEVLPFAEISADVSYSQEGAARRAVSRGGFAIQDALYGTTVVFTILVPIEQAADFIRELIDITRGGRVLQTGACYRFRHDGKLFPPP